MAYRGRCASCGEQAHRNASSLDPFGGRHHGGRSIPPDFHLFLTLSFESSINSRICSPCYNKYLTHKGHTPGQHHQTLPSHSVTPTAVPSQSVTAPTAPQAEGTSSSSAFSALTTRIRSLVDTPKSFFAKVPGRLDCFKRAVSRIKLMVGGVKQMLLSLITSRGRGCRDVQPRTLKKRARELSSLMQAVHHNPSQLILKHHQLYPHMYSDLFRTHINFNGLNWMSFYVHSHISKRVYTLLCHSFPPHVVPEYRVMRQYMRRMGMYHLLKGMSDGVCGHYVSDFRGYITLRLTQLIDLNPALQQQLLQGCVAGGHVSVEIVTGGDSLQAGTGSAKNFNILVLSFLISYIRLSNQANPVYVCHNAHSPSERCVYAIALIEHEKEPIMTQILIQTEQLFSQLQQQLTLTIRDIQAPVQIVRKVTGDLKVLGFEFGRLQLGNALYGCLLCDQHRYDRHEYKNPPALNLTLADMEQRFQRKIDNKGQERSPVVKVDPRTSVCVDIGLHGMITITTHLLELLFDCAELHDKETQLKFAHSLLQLHQQQQLQQKFDTIKQTLDSKLEEDKRRWKCITFAYESPRYGVYKSDYLTNRHTELSLTEQYKLFTTHHPTLVQQVKDYMSEHCIKTQIDSYCLQHGIVPVPGGGYIGEVCRRAMSEPACGALSEFMAAMNKKRGAAFLSLFSDLFAIYDICNSNQHIYSLTDPQLDVIATRFHNIVVSFLDTLTTHFPQRELTIYMHYLSHGAQLLRRDGSLYMYGCHGVESVQQQAKYDARFHTFKSTSQLTFLSNTKQLLFRAILRSDRYLKPIPRRKRKPKKKRRHIAPTTD